MSATINIQDVSRETWDRHRALVDRHRAALEEYLDQLCWWNKKVNLVSRNADRPLIWQHIVHSLAPIPLQLLPSSLPLLDAGTGGGLPGIPLALAAPRRTMTLNDMNHKKIAAVHQMARQLSLSNVEIYKGDFATYNPENPYILISKHSFKLKEVANYWQTHPRCRAAILYKGADYAEEWDSGELKSDCRLTAYHLGTHPESDFYTDKYIVVLRSETHKMTH